MRNGRQRVVLTRGEPPFAFPLLDGVLAVTRDTSRFVGGLARFFETDIGQAAETHFTTAAVDGNPQKPLRTPIGPLV